MLVECVALHEPSLKASFWAVYGIGYDAVDVLDAADLTAWLPEGSALWRSVGGPLSITGVERELRVVDYRLQVLAWMKTKDGQAGRKQPKPPSPPPYTGQAAANELHANRQAMARERRAAAT